MTAQTVRVAILVLVIRSAVSGDMMAKLLPEPSCCGDLMDYNVNMMMFDCLRCGWTVSAEEFHCPRHYTRRNKSTWQPPASHPLVKMDAELSNGT